MKTGRLTTSLSPTAQCHQWSAAVFPCTDAAGIERPPQSSFGGPVPL